MRASQIIKLYKKGRIIPIKKSDGKGGTWIVGFERKPGSRLQAEYWLRKPIQVSGAKKECPEKFTKESK